MARPLLPVVLPVVLPTALFPPRLPLPPRDEVEDEVTAGLVEFISSGVCFSLALAEPLPPLLPGPPRILPRPLLGFGGLTSASTGEKGKND